MGSNTLARTLNPVCLLLGDKDNIWRQCIDWYEIYWGVILSHDAAQCIYRPNLVLSSIDDVSICSLLIIKNVFTNICVFLVMISWERRLVSWSVYHREGLVSYLNTPHDYTTRWMNSSAILGIIHSHGHFDYVMCVLLLIFIASWTVWLHSVYSLCFQCSRNSGKQPNAIEGIDY